MSYTVSLTRSYGSFFLGCANFAVLPYSKTFFAIANSKRMQGEDLLTHAAAGAIVCGVLTFVVPVLPFLTSITSSLGTFAFILALASTLFTYPVALIADCCAHNSEDNSVLGQYC